MLPYLVKKYNNFLTTIMLVLTFTANVHLYIHSLKTYTFKFIYRNLKLYTCDTAYCIRHTYLQNNYCRISTLPTLQALFSNKYSQPGRIRSLVFVWATLLGNIVIICNLKFLLSAVTPQSPGS